MSIPNYRDVVADLARAHPDEWRAAHTGGPQTEAFIRRLAWVLHQRDPRFGLNGKRGNYDDISDDVVNYIGEGPGHDPRTGQPVTVIDVIVAAGGPNPQPAWNIINQPGPGGWVQPQPVGGDVPAPPPPPPPPPLPPPPPPPPPPVDLGPILAELAALRAELAAVDAKAQDAREQAAAAMAYATECRKVIADGLVVDGEVKLPRLFGTVKVTGTAKG